MSTNSDGYVIDTCSLIKLREDYPEDVFPSVWSFVSDLVDSRVLESIELVYDELNNQDDEVKAWADEHKEMFLPLNTEIQEEAVAILEEFPVKFVDLKKRKSGADPFIVAAAGVLDVVVVTEEKKTGNRSGEGKVKIPDVCAHYDIECIPLVELLRREGLSL